MTNWFQVGGDGEEDKIFFIWPTTIVHKIDSKSPLYNMSATNLLRERFEIVVILGKISFTVDLLFFFLLSLNWEPLLWNEPCTEQCQNIN